MSSLIGVPICYGWAKHGHISETLKVQNIKDIKFKFSDIVFITKRSTCLNPYHMVIADIRVVEEIAFLTEQIL